MVRDVVGNEDDSLLCGLYKLFGVVGAVGWGGMAGLVFEYCG